MFRQSAISESHFSSHAYNHMVYCSSFPRRLKSLPFSSLHCTKLHSGHLCWASAWSRNSSSFLDFHLTTSAISLYLTTFLWRSSSVLFIVLCMLSGCLCLQQTSGKSQLCVQNDNKLRQPLSASFPEPHYCRLMLQPLLTLCCSTLRSFLKATIQENVGLLAASTFLHHVERAKLF